VLLHVEVDGQRDAHLTVGTGQGLEQWDLAQRGQGLAGV